MTVTPASRAASTCDESCAPSLAPMMMTFAPFVTIELIWFCCSATVLLAGAFCTSASKPASVKASLKSDSASTQFSLVPSGSATPMSESAANPASASPPAWGASVLVEQPASASAVTAVNAATVSNFFICQSLSWCNCVGSISVSLEARGPSALRFLGAHHLGWESVGR